MNPEPWTWGVRRHRKEPSKGKERPPDIPKLPLSDVTERSACVPYLNEGAVARIDRCTDRGIHQSKTGGDSFRALGSSLALEEGNFDP
jgi:hypothetical protein